MNALGRFLTTPVGSALRVFAGLVLGSFVLYLSAGNDVAKIDVASVMTWVSAALVVAVPIVIAAINPQDPRFGAGS